MNRSLYLIGLLALSLTLAGCHAPEGEGDGGLVGNGDADDGGTNGADPDDGQTDGDDQQVTLMVVDPVSEATVGEPFNMTVTVDAAMATTSVHSGFHWWHNTTAEMDVIGDFDGASPHITNETMFPGTYTIPDWTLGDEHVGMIYVRAHTQADGMDWWGEEFEITVSAAS